MKILWVSEFPDDTGGIADCSSHVVELLEENDYSVDVLNNSGEGEKVVGEVPSNPLEWRSVLEDYDLLLVQYPGVRTLKLSSLPLSFSSIDSLMVMHEVPKGMRFLPALSFFDNFAFLSEKARKDFEEKFRLINRLKNPGIFDLPYHGVDREIKDNIEGLDFDTGIDSSKKTIVCPGFQVRRKQYHKMIEALPQLLEEFPDLELVMAGGPHRSEGDDYLNEMKESVKEKNLENHVRFTGSLEKENYVYKFILDSNICVLPYEEIYQSGILARSLALGTPTVVSNVDGLRKPVEEYGGLVLENLGTEEIVSKISSALKDEIKMERQRFIDDMNWESRVERYIEIIEEVSE